MTASNSYDAIIVGGSHGGAKAATALRQQGFEGTIAISGRELISRAIVIFKAGMAEESVRFWELRNHAPRSEMRARSGRCRSLSD